MELPPAVVRSPVRQVALLVAACALAYVAAAPYLAQVFSQLPAPAGRELPPVWVMLLAQGAQGLVMCAAMAALGVWAARRAGLSAPVLEGRAAPSSLLGMVPRGLVWGTVASVAVLGLSALFESSLPEGMQVHHQVQEVHGSHLAAAALGATSAFYGGVLEEVLLRWGLMSALMVGALRVMPRTAAFVLANVVSALLFAVGHLPLALHFGGGAAAVAFTLLGNTVAGVVFGWLFFRYSLEQAMVAHAWADVVLHALPLLVM